MDIRFSRPSIYTSHPIRGVSGDIQGNCQKALATARRLEKCFPEVSFYVPAAGDLTLQILSHHKRLSIEDIMFADLQILKACHGFVWLNWEPSKGCEIEWKEAQRIGLTVGYEDVIRDDLSKASYGVIRNRLQDVVVAAVERFRSGQ